MVLQIVQTTQRQTPPVQVPVLHVVPSATDVCWQPLVASQALLVHSFRSSQPRGMPAVQVPAWQVSLPLQTVAAAARSAVADAGGLAAEEGVTAVGRAGVGVIAAQAHARGAGTSLAGLGTVAHRGVGVRGAGVFV